MRTPKFAGLFYKAGPESLRKELESLFLHEKGPGALPVRKANDDRNRVVKGVVVPHAGYSFSGPCAAWSYLALSEAPMPDVYVLIGPNHRSADSGLTTETFLTPLGSVRVDQSLARMIVEKGHIGFNDLIHEVEHSLEVQLPFLQFINGSDAERMKILPILLGDIAYSELKELVIDIKESLVESGKSAIFVISSDFTHHGPAYHHVRFSRDVQRQIYSFDEEAIKFIINNDDEGFNRFVRTELATICGWKAIIAGIRLMKPYKARLEQFYTSVDILSDEEASKEKNSVSYASIIFE